MSFFENTTWFIVIFPKVRLGLTISFTVFYAFVFIAAYIQLWLVLYLGHKLVSTQTVYFFLCCLFTSQRIILFCFFFEYTSTNNDFNSFVSWFLISFPILVHYLIMLLITVFYYKTYAKSKGISSKLNKYHYLVIVTPIVALFILHLFPFWYKDPTNDFEYARNFDYKAVRIIVTDVIFIGTILFFVHIYKQFPKFPNAILVHEAKRITITRTIIVGLVCISISIFKLVYDIAALILAERKSPFLLPTGIEKRNFINNSEDYKPFMIFGSILFLWEVAPLIAAMIVFRVQFPNRISVIGKVGLNKEVNPSLHSSSNTTNSSSTTKSKFIGVPKYGTINAYLSSMETSSGPLSPGYFGSSQVLPYSYQRQDDNSYERENLPRNALKPNYYVDARSRLADVNSKPSSYKQKPKAALLKPGNRYIWRSVSNLTKTKTIEEDTDPKMKSAHLSTAKEE